MEHNVKHYMTGNPVIIDPECTIEEAAIKMAEEDCGIFPVGTADMPIGMVTDRDLVVRAVAKKKSVAATKVRDIMTEIVFWVPENATLEEAVDKMNSHQVSRLPVRDYNGKVIGILSLGHLIRSAQPHVVVQLVKHMRNKLAA